MLPVCGVRDLGGGDQRLGVGGEADLGEAVGAVGQAEGVADRVGAVEVEDLALVRLTGGGELGGRRAGAHGTIREGSLVSGTTGSGAVAERVTEAARPGRSR